jgi:hypothetical protein
MQSPNNNTEDVNHYKRVFDIAPTTLDKRPRYYVNIRSDEIEDLNSRAYVSLSAKWTWLRLKMLMTDTEQPGILIENGQPIPVETLAVILNRRPTSIEKLRREIDELLNARVLRTHKGFIYDYVLLSDEWSRARRNNKELPGSFEEVLSTFPQVFPKFSQNSTKTPKNSPGETSGSSNSRNSSTTKESTTTTKESTTTTVLTENNSNNGQTVSASAVAASTFALKNWEPYLAEEQAKYPGLNVRVEFGKLSQRNEEPTPQSINGMRKWMQKGAARLAKSEAAKSPATNPKSPTKPAKPSKKTAKQEKAEAAEAEAAEIEERRQARIEATAEFFYENYGAGIFENFEAFEMRDKFDHIGFEKSKFFPTAADVIRYAEQQKHLKRLPDRRLVGSENYDQELANFQAAEKLAAEQKAAAEAAAAKLAKEEAEKARIKAAEEAKAAEQARQEERERKKAERMANDPVFREKELARLERIKEMEANPIRIPSMPEWFTN